jgi:hypothetical protein
MAVYGPVRYQKNSIWTDASEVHIVFFFGDGPVHILPYDPKWIWVGTHNLVFNSGYKALILFFFWNIFNVQGACPLQKRCQLWSNRIIRIYYTLRFYFP